MLHGVLHLLHARTNICRAYLAVSVALLGFLPVVWSDLRSVEFGSGLPVGADGFVRGFRKCVEGGWSFHVGIPHDFTMSVGFCSSADFDETSIFHILNGSISCEMVQHECAWIGDFYEPSFPRGELFQDWPLALREFTVPFRISAQAILWSCCNQVRGNPYTFLSKALTAQIRGDCFQGNMQDTAGHLPFMRMLASRPEVSSIVEFGTRRGVSTTAFLLGLADQSKLGSSHTLSLHSYDIRLFQDAEMFNEIALSFGISHGHTEESSLDADLQPTDLLYLDTLHCYGQVKRELAKHHQKIRRYIVLHDTLHFGQSSWVDGELCRPFQDSGWSEEDVSWGIQLAVKAFLNEQPQWKELVYFEYDFGLTVLARKD